MKSPLTRTEDGTAFYNRIKQALVECCDQTPAQAEQLIRQFFSDLEFLEDDEFLYTETPYYYAMCIAHHPTFGDNEPEWYLNPKYFPPPEAWRA